MTRKIYPGLGFADNKTCLGIQTGFILTGTYMQRMRKLQRTGWNKKILLASNVLPTFAVWREGSECRRGDEIFSAGLLPTMI
jgi:hypothetical protein